MIHFTQADIDRFIEEDLPYHDETTHALGIGARTGRLEFSAKKDGFILCGSEEAARIGQCLGARADLCRPSGAWIEPGESFLRLSGTATALHHAWKVGLTLMETASAVATRTRQMVERASAQRPGVRVATTRKAPPGLRKLMFKAVLAGGGIIHRAGLSETLLVFAQHRVFLPSGETLAETVARLRRNSPEKKIMVETATPEEALQAAAAGADVIQMEKFALPDLERAVAALRRQFPGTALSATGGIRLDNVADYARCDVDLLVTTHPYHAPPADIRAVMLPDSATNG